MSEQGSQLKDQPEIPNLDHQDYEANEEQVLRALAKLRLLNDTKHPLSLKQVIARAHQIHEMYERWERSKAPIKGIDVRLSNNEEIHLIHIHRHQRDVHVNTTLPASTTLDIWKAADEEFGEVLLLRLSLSDVTAEEHAFERAYPNGQTLSLLLERRLSGEFSISVKVTEPSAELCVSAEANELGYRANILRFYRMLSQSLKLRLTYALAALALMMSLPFSLLRDFGVSRSPQMVQSEEGMTEHLPQLVYEGEGPATGAARKPASTHSKPEAYTQLASRPSVSPPSRGMPTPLTRMRKGGPRREVALTFPAVILQRFVVLRNEKQPLNIVPRVFKPKTPVRFILRLPDAVGPGTYTITLTRMDGEKLLTTLRNSPNGRVLSVSVPALILSEGSYTLLVSSPNGPPFEYRFTIVERDKSRRKGDDEARPADDPLLPKPASEPLEI